MSMSRKPVMTIHDFYCINCGEKGISLPRKRGRQYGKFHRKKMYCPHCGAIVNHIEVRNDIETWEFKNAFDAGEFEEEAKESLEFIKEESGYINDY